MHGIFTDPRPDPAAWEAVRDIIRDVLGGDMSKLDDWNVESTYDPRTNIRHVGIILIFCDGGRRVRRLTFDDCDRRPSQSCFLEIANATRAMYAEYVAAGYELAGNPGGNA